MVEVVMLVVVVVGGDGLGGGRGGVVMLVLVVAGVLTVKGLFLQSDSSSLHLTVRSCPEWAGERRLALNVLLTETSKLSPCHHS